MTEVDLFQANRAALFGVAYRMLGSATDAEDVVQDAWLRFSSARPADLRSAKSYLTTIVTRLCLDRLKSARATREEYIGPWLPEPVVTDDRREPERSLAQAESVTLAFMVLLETLSPEERAVFLLREVFDYEYDEIAAMLETTVANCRQLFHRAKLRSLLIHFDVVTGLHKTRGGGKASEAGAGNKNFTLLHLGSFRFKRQPCAFRSRSCRQ